MKVSELALRAMRLAGVLEAGETPSSEEQSDALDALNDMMAAWALDGVYVGWSTHAWTDTIAVPDEYLRGVRYALAVELCNEFAVPIPAGVLGIASKEKAKLIEDNVEIPDADFEVTLLTPAGYSVVTDS